MLRLNKVQPDKRRSVCVCTVQLIGKGFTDSFIHTGKGHNILSSSIGS